LVIQVAIRLAGSLGVGNLQKVEVIDAVGRQAGPALETALGECLPYRRPGQTTVIRPGV
jgi:hypothetical protein